jgi:MtN3 and saliva related transmembrane protein
MKFEILDPNVSKTMNVFIIIGNIITLVQNVPQVIKTYKIKSTKDFSGWFLLMRVAACFIWGSYSIEIDSLLMLINNLITLSATTFLGYYKIKEIMYDYKKKQLNMYVEIQNKSYKDNNDVDVEIISSV